MKVAISALLPLLVTVVACSAPPAAEQTAAATPEPVATATPLVTTTEAAATPTQEEKPMSYYENKVVELHTGAGDITIRFFPELAPNHVRNFIDLSESGFYDGTKFHRIVPGFVIQGGDPNTKGGDPATWGTGGSGRHLQAEFNSRHHARGIVSMARAADPDSASSQFFIVVADAPSLDNQYSVFGEVTKGMDVVDKIVSAPARGQAPIDPVEIRSVTVREATDSEKSSN